MDASTTIVAADGSFIATLQEENRQPVTLDRASQGMQDALVLIEYYPLYDHDGVDLDGIMGATASNLSSEYDPRCLDHHPAVRHRRPDRFRPAQRRARDLPGTAPQEPRDRRDARPRNDHREEHDDAIATELGLTGTPTLDGCTGSAQGAYLCAYATHLILDDTAYRATVEDRQEVLYRSDLTIRTTLDRREQAAAHAVMNDTADKASR